MEEQLLLQNPSFERLEVLVNASTVYHAIKLGHPAAVAMAQRSSDCRELQSLIDSIASANAIKFGFGQRGHEAGPGRVATQPAIDTSPFCEPERNDLDEGQHHASRSQHDAYEAAPVGA